MGCEIAECHSLGSSEQLRCSSAGCGCTVELRVCSGSFEHVVADHVAKGCKTMNKRRERERGENDHDYYDATMAATSLTPSRTSRTAGQSQH
jgi:hypothetical protein